MLAFPMSDGGCEHLATVVGRLSFSLLLLLPWLLAMEQGSTKKQHSQQPEGKSNIHVYVRVRPLSNEEIAQGEKFSVQLSRDEQSIKVLDRGYSSSSIAFQFDGCIGPTVGQEEMMQKLRLQKLLNKVLEGYSSTVMAYGQTGSGKTFTMSGRQEFLQASNNLKSPTDGLIARAVTYLFGATKSQSTENNPKSFTIKASYFEVYNEQVNDLLRLNCAPREVKWSPNEGFYVADLLLVECEMVDDVFSVLDEGAKNRKMGSHNLNKDSSRSHCVMTLHMDSHWKLDDGPTIIRHGRMIFVDLAGSERLKKTKSSGDMLKETGNINRSLFTLGKVISALAEGKRKDVIPYRESTLTKLLMESLGGSSLALMIACISPALSAIDETMSTLHYASCTKTIVNLPLVNMDEKDKVIVSLQKELMQLREENCLLRSKLGLSSKRFTTNATSNSNKQEAPTYFVNGDANLRLSHINCKKKIEPTNKDGKLQVTLYQSNLSFKDGTPFIDRVNEKKNHDSKLSNLELIKVFSNGFSMEERASKPSFKCEREIHTQHDSHVATIGKETINKQISKRHRIFVDHFGPMNATKIMSRASLGKNEMQETKLQGSIILNNNASMHLLDLEISKDHNNDLVNY